MEEISVSKTSEAEFISLQLLKLVANPNPFAAIVNAFCDGLNTLQINNIIEVLNELKTRIDIIEERTGRNLYFDKIVFEEDILPVLQKAKDGANAQKRKLYVAFIAACIHPDNLDCNNKGIFSHYLDKLDYLSVYILNGLESYLTEKQLVAKIGGNYDVNVILVHLWDLKANNLVNNINAEEFERLHRRYGNIKHLHSENVFLYKRNKFGGEFLKFIIKGMPNEQL
ncbi:MAG: hypothetical protein IKX61_00120 [Prevotella sp.]|nr:hypothetical protein [Prevotella sp.]